MAALVDVAVVVVMCVAVVFVVAVVVAVMVAVVAVVLVVTVVRLSGQARGCPSSCLRDRSAEFTQCARSGLASWARSRWAWRLDVRSPQARARHRRRGPRGPHTAPARVTSRESTDARLLARAVPEPADGRHRFEHAVVGLAPLAGCTHSAICSIQDYGRPE